MHRRARLTALFIIGITQGHSPARRGTAPEPRGTAHFGDLCEPESVGQAGANRFGLPGLRRIAGVEPETHHNNGLCGGAGGAQMWMEEQTKTA
jgi:hypothetical protein